MWESLGVIDGFGGRGEERHTYLVKLPGRVLACTRQALDITHPLLQFNAANIGERQPGHDDASAEPVREVDAWVSTVAMYPQRTFRELAADDGEQQRPRAGSAPVVELGRLDRVRVVPEYAFDFRGRLGLVEDLLVSGLQALGTHLLPLVELR